MFKKSGKNNTSNFFVCLLFRSLEKQNTFPACNADLGMQDSPVQNQQGRSFNEAGLLPKTLLPRTFGTLEVLVSVLQQG